MYLSIVLSLETAESDVFAVSAEPETALPSRAVTSRVSAPAGVNVAPRRRISRWIPESENTLCFAPKYVHSLWLMSYWKSFCCGCSGELQVRKTRTVNIVTFEGPVIPKHLH